MATSNRSGRTPQENVLLGYAIPGSNVPGKQTPEEMGYPPVVGTHHWAANLVQREALVMTYNDAIMLLGCLFVAGLFLMPLVGRPRVAGAAGH
jgi:hypothetical protein